MLTELHTNFDVAQQPQAGAVNIGVMHEAITALVEHACEGDAKLPEYKKRIQETYRVGYAKHFQAENSKNRRAKLGLVNSGEVADGIWKELMRLMGPSVSGQVFVRFPTHSVHSRCICAGTSAPCPLSSSNVSLARTNRELESVPICQLQDSLLFSCGSNAGWRWSGLHHLLQALV